MTIVEEKIKMVKSRLVGDNLLAVRWNSSLYPHEFVVLKELIC
jgi:hypothetical protein